MYDNIPADRRTTANSFRYWSHFGSMTVLDACSKKLSIEGGLDSLNLSDRSSDIDPCVKELNIISIATNQIKVTGLHFIRDGAQLTIFAGWFLHAGEYCYEIEDIFDLDSVFTLAFMIKQCTGKEAAEYSNIYLTTRRGLHFLPMDRGLETLQPNYAESYTKAQLLHPWRLAIVPMLKSMHAPL